VNPLDVFSLQLPLFAPFCYQAGLFKATARAPHDEGWQKMVEILQE